MMVRQGMADLPTFQQARYLQVLVQAVVIAMALEAQMDATAAPLSIIEYRRQLKWR